jgi:hypothetical protein
MPIPTAVATGARIIGSARVQSVAPTPQTVVAASCSSELRAAHPTSASTPRWRGRSTERHRECAIRTSRP